MFKNNLYFDLANKANEFAYSISDAFVNKGYKLFKKTQSNQIFLILPNSLIEKLQMKFTFSIWEEYDKENSIVRLVTSWATNEEKVEELINCI